MICRELISIIEEQYPREAALEWDNVGLLVGRFEKDIQKVFVALDLTDDVVDEAIDKDVDLIVTHHPMIFEPQRRVTDETLIGRRLIRLLQNDIGCYAAHTNYDVLQMAQLAEARLGLVDAKVLEETGWNEEGIGRIGALKQEMALEECCEMVKEAFDLTSVKVFGDLKGAVRIAAISPGSGKSMIQIAIEKGADVLITGDIDHHAGIDAVAEGMAIIDAGHYGLEYIFMEDMTEFLRKRTNLEVEMKKVSFPFQNL